MNIQKTPPSRAGEGDAYLADGLDGAFDNSDYSTGDVEFNGLVLTRDQDRALAAVRAWRADSFEQVFRLHGYAGTGKTTLANLIAREAGGRVGFVAPTNKACFVLTQKGCPATTLHHLLYVVAGEDERGQPIFALRNRPACAFDTLIVDEGSMVNAALVDDLLGTGRRIIGIADPFQLPPVRGVAPFATQAPHAMLTQITRQAKDSGIIRASLDLRERGRLDFRPGAYGPDVQLLAGRGRQPPERVWLAADQILCGLHVTRMGLNRQSRAARGFEGFYPCIGEKIMSCFNADGFRNGAMFTVVDAQETPKTVRLTLQSLDDDSALTRDLGPHSFEDPAGKQDDKAPFQSGYAITVHKAQGSQWEKVAIWAEPHGGTAEAGRRWVYTALTRAQSKVVLYSPSKP